MQFTRGSQQKFADLCAAQGTVRSIEAVYEAHGFDLPAGFEPSQGGMRRSVCAAAEDGADLFDGQVQQRLLRVYLDGIDDFGRRSTDVFYVPGAEPEDPLWPEARALVRSLMPASPRTQRAPSSSSCWRPGTSGRPREDEVFDADDREVRMTAPTLTVMGVDWYRRGWVAVVLEGDRAPRAIVGQDLEALIRDVPNLACVAIDMPIGLPATERQADLRARKYVGPRWQSLFITPPAEVLAAETYTEANAIAARLLSGKRISQQAWALRHNIERVAGVAAHDDRIIEVHPEVSFCALVGAHLKFPKTTWNGQATRRHALERTGIALPDDLGDAGAAPVADVLDAAVAAWSARRYATGDAQSLPPDAERGARQVIWY